jgi:hypothetical protein
MRLVTSLVFVWRSVAGRSGVGPDFGGDGFDPRSALRARRSPFARWGSVEILSEFPPAGSWSLWAGSTRVHSIRVRRCAPEIESVARARRGSEGRSATQRTDDSVFGVVELQSVPGVGELRCAGRFGPGRREGISSGSARVSMGDGIRKAERAETA